MNSKWIDSLTEDQKREAGLLPDQIKSRFEKQLAILQDPKQAIQCRENDITQNVLKAAIRRLS